MTLHALKAGMSVTLKSDGWEVGTLCHNAYLHTDVLNLQTYTPTDMRTPSVSSAAIKIPASAILKNLKDA